MARKPTNSRNSRLRSLGNAAERTARGLCDERGVRVVLGGAPKYDWTTKTLTVPAWDEDRMGDLVDEWRGLLDHEMAHVVLTDFDYLQRAQSSWEQQYGKALHAIFDLTNHLEDGRIEPIWGEMYPGAVHNLDAANRFFINTVSVLDSTDPNFCPPIAIGSPKKGNPIGPWKAMSMAFKYAKLGYATWDDLHPETQNLLAYIGEELWNAALDADTTRACGATAEEIYKKIKDIKPPPEAPEEEPDPNADGKGKAGQGEGAGTIGDEAERSKGRGYGGAGGYPEPKDIKPVAIGGDWGEIQTLGDVLATEVIKTTGPNDIPPYTVHPAGAAQDKLIEYDERARQRGAKKLAQLQKAAGPPTHRLVTMMRAAIQSTKQDRWVGALEEGCELDPDAIGAIAQGLNGPDVMRDRTMTAAQSTGVVILVDCSGSMGDSDPAWQCPHHNPRPGVYDRMSRPCCPEGRPVVVTPAGYASITATALHNAFRTTRTPHAVLGHTTRVDRAAMRRTARATDGDEYGNVPNEYVRLGNREFLRWSRVSSGLAMHEFVAAPGIHDKGEALPYITGRQTNLDGEAVLWAARYGAEHFGHLGRVILISIADGYPTGADCWDIQGPYLQKVVDLVAHAGIEVYGLGVGIGDFETFASYYPNIPEQPGRAPTGSIEIKSGEGLTETTLRAMIDLFMMGRGATRTLRSA